jgi:osmotically-inducible protein OsmY
MKTNAQETCAFLTGAAIGAAVMYMLDPVQGRRRRSTMNDKLRSATGSACEVLEQTARHISNQVHGVIAEAQSMLHTEPVTDETLAERVKSKMGRAVSHSGLIDVDVRDGVVILRGTVSAYEVGDLLTAIRSARGVGRIQNELEVDHNIGAPHPFQRAAT